MAKFPSNDSEDDLITLHMFRTIRIHPDYIKSGELYKSVANGRELDHNVLTEQGAVVYIVTN